MALVSPCAPFILTDWNVRGGASLGALEARNALAATDVAHAAHRSDAYIVFWFLFQILGGQVMMPILMYTFAFTRARRHPSLVNFCASFFLTGLCSSLLLYSGQLKGPEPDLMLCIFQAATANALPPMWSTALLFFVLYLRRSIHDPDGKEPEHLTISTFAKIAFPYVVFLTYLVVGCTLGSLHPEKVSRDDRVIYCDNNNDAFDIASASYSAIAALASLVLTAPLAIHLARAYPWFCKVRNATATHNLALRLCVFLIFIVVGIFFAIWSNLDEVNASTRDMYIAITPVALFLVFGSQSDVLRVWCFWKRRTALLTPSDDNVRVIVIGKRNNDAEKDLPELPYFPKSPLPA